MIVLAIDCSLAACSTAVYDATHKRVLAQRFAVMERGQAEAIAPMARDAIAEAGHAVGAIDRIAVTLGPGTFTGIRIGLALAKGMGLALHREVIGIDSLRAIAANAGDLAGTIVVANHARGDEIYLAIFRMPDEIILAPMRVSLAEAIERLPAAPLSVMGDAKSVLIASADRRNMGALDCADVPIAAHFAHLAVDDKPTGHPLRPLYLAESYAKLPGTSSSAKQAIALSVAAGNDVALIATLHQACFDPAWPAADLARLLAMPGAMALIARQGGVPVGFILVRAAADEAEIITIGTLPAARRRGIGTQLIETAVARLGAPIARLIIEVASSNEAALALYRSLGFTQIGARRGYYDKADGGREDAVVMHKEISR